MHGEGDLFTDIAHHALPKAGGVFYVRGGFGNIRGVDPADPERRTIPIAAGLTEAERKTIAMTKSGDDDHPGYSDRQISEAMNAEVINAIAADPGPVERERHRHHLRRIGRLLRPCAVPRILSYGPDGLPLSRGIRVPLLLISPYARAHAVSHAEGDHNAVIETINAVFGLHPALATAG